MQSGRRCCYDTMMPQAEWYHHTFQFRPQGGRKVAKINKYKNCFCNDYTKAMGK
jgi:hypothetical protein